VLISKEHWVKNACSWKICIYDAKHLFESPIACIFGSSSIQSSEEWRITGQLNTANKKIKIESLPRGIVQETLAIHIIEALKGAINKRVAKSHYKQFEYFWVINIL
jgi:hypothetical protein